MALVRFTSTSFLNLCIRYLTVVLFFVILLHLYNLQSTIITTGASPSTRSGKKMSSLANLIQQTEKFYEGPKKLILLWRQKRSKHNIQDIIDETHCGGLKFCDITSDYNRIKEADAVIVNWNPKTVMPSVNRRSSNQIWVFAQQHPFKSLDNSTYFLELSKMKNTFNLSMGFWQAPDIRYPTGSLLFNPNYSSDDSKDSSDHYSSKLAVYCRSNNNNSNSIPDLLVEALSSYMEIDTLTYCPDTVEKYSDPDLFFKQISKTYKFYFLFDDTLCDYYVSPTFYMLLKYGIVPVLLSTNVHDFPPNVFINVMNFRTVREIANYLIMLDKNQKLYANFFLWKRLHEVRVPSHQGLCDLCLRLIDGVIIDPDRTINNDPIDRILSNVPFCRKLHLSDDQALIKDLQRVHFKNDEV